MAARRRSAVSGIERRRPDENQVDDEAKAAGIRRSMKWQAPGVAVPSKSIPFFGSSESTSNGKRTTEDSR